MKRIVIFLFLIFPLQIFCFGMVRRLPFRLCHSFVVKDKNYFLACLDDRIECGELKGKIFRDPKRCGILYSEIQGARLLDIVGHFISEDLGFVIVVFKNGRFIRVDLRDGQYLIKRIPNPHQTFFSTWPDVRDTGSSLPDIRRARTDEDVYGSARSSIPRFIDKIIFDPSGTLYAMRIRSICVRGGYDVCIGSLNFGPIPNQDSQCKGVKFDATTIGFSGESVIKGEPLVFSEDNKYLVTDDKNTSLLYVYNVEKFKRRVRFSYSRQGAIHTRILSAFFVNIIGRNPWIVFVICSGGRFEIVLKDLNQNSRVYQIRSDYNLGQKELDLIVKILREQLSVSGVGIDSHRLRQLFEKGMAERDYASLPSICGISDFDRYDPGQPFFKYIKGFEPEYYSGTDFFC